MKAKSRGYGCPMSEDEIGQTGQGENAAVMRVSARVSPSRGVRPRDEKSEHLPADRLDYDTLDWFLVRVMAGQEARARMTLRAAGFGTCLPMRRVWQKQNRFHNRLVTRAYAVLPGYLFVGMSVDTPGWPVLMQPGCVLSVVGFDGTPYRLAKCIVDHVAGQYEDLWYPLPAGCKHKGGRPDFRAGDYVHVLTGPFERHVVPVEKIGQDQAVVLVKLFGRDMPVSIRLDDLRKSL